MERNSNYKTKQKDIILDKIKSIKEEFTVKELYSKLNKEIGLTTIYRFIDKLVEDGTVTKIVHSNNSIYYQYLEECNHDNHFYLKCNKCGEMIHIDCDCINEFIDIVKNNHNFYINTKNIIIDGTCNKCYKEN